MPSAPSEGGGSGVRSSDIEPLKCPVWLSRRHPSPSPQPPSSSSLFPFLSPSHGREAPWLSLEVVTQGRLQ